MNNVALKAELVVLLRSIAPEIEAETLRADRPLRSQVDLDSMDWLKFLTAVHERTGVDIAESDYARLVTLDDLTDYVAVRKDAKGL